MVRIPGGRVARHKFKAVPVVEDGVRFDSKLEAAYYRYLRRAQEGGDVVGFLRQPRFDLPGGTHYTADFLVFWADGRVETVDVKGVETEAFKVRYKAARALHPWMPFTIVKVVPPYLPTNRIKEG